ncbi:MAG: hypothetical protein K2L54_06075, partial [Clostridiales bacterium]|nr:hypothetical protein [Clostridiales bacterium]
AVYSVYAPYLMKRQYPLFVLHITMPCDMVDVNVHPSKLQVKFADTLKVKSIVARAVKNAVQPKLTDVKQLRDEDFGIEPPPIDYGKSHTLMRSFFDVSPQQNMRENIDVAQSALESASTEPIANNEFLFDVANEKTSPSTEVEERY